MSKIFYLDDFQGMSGGGVEALGQDVIVRLPDQPCKLVKLYNWNVDDTVNLVSKGGAGLAGPEDDLQEIYYGFGSIFIGQIFQGRETDYLPVTNLNQIIVRARPLQTSRVYYAWFW